MTSTELFPGQWQPQVVLMAALRVGLIEALLDEPRASEELVSALSLDERAALRVIGVLVDAGWLERRSDGLIVAPEVRALLDSRSEEYVGDRLRPPPRPARALGAAARGAARGRPGAL